MFGPAGSRDHQPRGIRAQVDDPITPNARTPERAQEYRAFFLTDDLHGRRFRTHGESATGQSTAITSEMPVFRQGQETAGVLSAGETRKVQLNLICKG